jgi:hypothetical protein
MNTRSKSDVNSTNRTSSTLLPLIASRTVDTAIAAA